METPEFDQLLSSYKQAVDHWVDAIRAEEALANADHSMVEMELWGQTPRYKLQDAESTGEKARDEYKNALRKKELWVLIRFPRGDGFHRKGPQRLPTLRPLWPACRRTTFLLRLRRTPSVFGCGWGGAAYAGPWLLSDGYARG